MAENKFIKRLKGEQAVGSLVEIKNQNTPASFGNMPQGTSDSNVKYSDVRGDVTVVANGTTAWKLNNSALTLAPIVNGDGTDYISNYAVSGAGLWINSTYTFPSTGDPNHPVAMIFNPNTKWVLKLCGDNLIVNNGETLELNVIITIGTSNIISKQFTIREQANQFCKELVIDFDESNSALIKASGLSTMQLQVLCGTADASARIYNGMTTLTVLQRKVDAAVVSGAFANVEEVLRDGILPSDYFSNTAYIAQIEDGDSAYAVFTRDGDTVALSGWTQPIPDQTNNAGKFLTTDGSLMSWKEFSFSALAGSPYDNTNLSNALNAKASASRLTAHTSNTNNPHSVTKAQVGLGNVDNTSDLNKPISTATQNALNLKADKTTTYTKTETDILLSGKQATISDLAAIRSNAQAGKAASDTIATYGNIVTHNVSEFATAAQGAKADTAVQPSDLGNGTITITQGGITKGTFTTNQSRNTTIALDAGGGGGAVDSVNGKTGVVVLTATDVGALPDSTVIPTVNNPTITITQGGVTKGSFTLNQATGDTIALDAGGGGSVDIDNSTITKNGSDQLQAVATINANTAVGATNPIYDWVGTLAEYNAQAVATNHPDWVCFITDDLTSGAYDAYSKSQTDALLANKVSTGHEVIEFQAPNAGNNYTWYRKYADGWVEQGGIYNPAFTGTKTFAYPVEMADTNYTLTTGTGCPSVSGMHGKDYITAKTTTGFSFTSVSLAGSFTVSLFNWQVSGMAA